MLHLRPSSAGLLQESSSCGVSQQILLLDFAVNRRAEAEIQNLSRKLNLLTDKFCDLDDLLRERLPSGAGAAPRS